MIENTQLSLADVNDEYKAFVDKFKPKKTTDDCYTPQETYEAIKEWAVKEYGLDGKPVVRPFWPGGDYEREEYPDGCVVIDNPPFSILAAICAHYQSAGIKFFLFSPYLTCFSVLRQEGVACIVVDATITYENGAKVNTCFVTNLESEYIVRSAPDLAKTIKETEDRRLSEGKPTLPKYCYPPYVLTATMVGYMSKYGVDFRVRRKSARFIRSLDSQKAAGKAIFGSGLLLSEKAAAEKAAAEKAAAEKAAAEKAAAEKAAAEKAAAEKAAAEKADFVEWTLSDGELAAIKALSEGDDDD